MINNIRDFKEEERQYLQTRIMYMLCLFAKGGVIARNNLFQLMMLIDI